MIGCQMNSLDCGLAAQLEQQQQQHIQAPQYGYHPATPTTPISPVFGGAMYNNQDQQQQLQPMQSSYLVRSKSLNDISNDSQIPAFASDRFINLHPNQVSANNNIVNGNPYPNGNPNLYAGDNTQQDGLMNQHQFQVNKHALQSHQHNLTQVAISSQSSVPMVSPYSYFANSHQQGQQLTRNFNDNQCSNINDSNGKPFGTNTNSSVSTAIIDLCNPMVVNLNGVTEQIGNLHL